MHCFIVCKLVNLRKNVIWGRGSKDASIYKNQYVLITRHRHIMFFSRLAKRIAGLATSASYYITKIGESLGIVFEVKTRHLNKQ